MAAAPTITRELRAEGGARLDPEQAAKITVPVLLLIGENSSDPAKADIETVAAALPDTRIEVLEGQEHVFRVCYGVLARELMHSPKRLRR